MNKLFATYNRLFPGKADVIIDAMNRAEKEADSQNLMGKEKDDYIESEILDAVNP